MGLQFKTKLRQRYDLIFLIDYFDGHVNAAAMLDAPGGSYLHASFGGYLCVFDADGSDCYDEPLALATPNVGVTVGTTYYYGKNCGRDGGETLYYVTNMDGPYGGDGAAPVFRADVSFAFAGDLWAGAVLDLAAVEEDGRREYVDDGEADGIYLVGLGYQFEVVVVKVDADTRRPVAYAALASTVDWGASTPESGDSGFGAAYAFDGHAGKRVFLSSNVGYGLFEVALPLVVDASCWNADADVAGHVFCASDVARVSRVSDAVFTSYNDGTNCPDVRAPASPLRGAFSSDSRARRSTRTRARGRRVPRRCPWPRSTARRTTGRSRF